MRKFNLAIAVALVLGSMPAFAAGSAGADPLNFLFLDANARAVAMGGAYTALATDSNALLYNPAGLGRIERHEATFMHNQYFEGITQEYIGFASRQGWGANLNFLNSGNLDRTTFANPNGGVGSVGATDLAFSAGYGRPFGDSLSLGVGLKYIRETLAGETASAFAADFGALYAVPALKGLTLGLAVQNIGPTVKFQSANENLPLNVRAGGAYEFAIAGQRNTVSLDVSKERSDTTLVGIGLETVIAQMMPLRFGFNTRNDAGIGISAGVGWIYKDAAFDYAFVPYGDLGMAHRISATLRWGSAPRGSRYEN